MPSFPPETIFSLTDNDPVETSIVDANGRELYRVTGPNYQTFVYDARGETVASCEWRFFHQNRVTWRSNAPIAMNDWMQSSSNPFSSNLSFTEAGRRYKWKGNDPNSSLKLFSESDGFSQPVARFVKPQKLAGRSSWWRPHPRSAATLVLTPRAMEIQDLVVVSFLFIEKSRREKERRARDRRMNNSMAFNAAASGASGPSC